MKKYTPLWQVILRSAGTVALWSYSFWMGMITIQLAGTSASNGPLPTFAAGLLVGIIASLIGGIVSFRKSNPPYSKVCMTILMGASCMFLLGIGTYGIHWWVFSPS